MRRCPEPTIPTIPTSGIRPFGGTTNIYQYNSGGVFEQNQLITNFRVSLGSKLSLFGFYSLELRQQRSRLRRTRSRCRPAEAAALAAPSAVAAAARRSS